MGASDQEKEGGSQPAPDPKPEGDAPPAAGPNSRVWQDEPAATDGEQDEDDDDDAEQ